MTPAQHPDIQLRAGKRMRFRVLVAIPQVSLTMVGGLAFAAQQIANAGFQDVRVADAMPPSWAPRARPTETNGSEWLLWVEATPARDAVMSPQLVEGATITDAWLVDAPAQPTASRSSAPTGVPALVGGPSSPAAIAGLLLGTGLLGGLVAWAVAQRRRELRREAA